MSKSTAQRLAELRLLYERTVAQVEDSFEARIAKAKKELKDAENFDYTKDFTDRYDASLVSLERLYGNIALTHQATKGIGFRIDRYVATVQPRTIAKGGVEDHLIMLVKECRSAIAAVSKSVTPEEDIEHLKRFAQGLVDLRYIAKNGRKLILDSGEPQRLKEERVYRAQSALDKVEAEREVALKFQNLACYDELENFRLETIANARRAKSRMLGGENETFGESDDNKFLMGFYTVQIDQEDLAFAENVLELTRDELSVEPIFFELKENHSVILINAKKEFFQDFLFDDLISNIYFSFATGMPAKQLQFRAVEAGVSEAVLEGLGALVAANMQDETCQVANDLDGMEKITGVLRDITKMAFARSGIYRMQHVRSIFEYNRKVEENPDKFVFFAINHYPYGFNSTRGIGGKELIKTINDCDTKGLITVVCQATDAEFSDTAPMLTPELLNADCIEIDGENYFYNGHPASLNIRSEEFDIEKYWNKLDKYSKEASSLWLKDVLKQAENRSSAMELPSVDKQIRIPIGNSGGNYFELVMSTCSRENHGLIVGPTGSGKSAFLHTMILSAASRYSPEELRFCLVDFKSSKDSPEFSQYRKRKGVENLYIPHVDYLLVNGKPECVFDLFGKINAMIRERGVLMSQCGGGAGVGELSVYNQSEDVRSGKMPRMPYVFFIIDEYNVMINGGLTDEGVAKNSTTLRSQIVSTLTSIAKTARAFGIGIILSGQDVAEELASNGLGQFGTRIALRTKSEGDYAKLMNIKSFEGKADLQFLTDVGYAVFSTKDGDARQKVRLAYSGKTGSKAQQEIAAKIRKKYGETAQVEAGREEAYPIGEAHSLKPFKDEVGSKDEKYFHVPLGVASASMLTVGLEYSYDAGGLNYFAFANKSKLYAIERSATFAYLDKMSALYGNNFPAVSYIAIRAHALSCLGEYMDAFPFLKKKIALATKRSEMLQEIERLYEIFEDRKRQADEDVVEFSPMLAVMHDVEWLLDLNASDLEEEKEEPAPARDTLDDGALMAKVSGLGKGGKVDLSALMSSVMDDEETSAPDPAPKKNKKLTADDYRKMLGAIYARGNRYGIFLLVGSENYSPINKVLFAATEEKDTAKSYAIYGSAAEQSSRERDKGAAADCIYACPSEVKARLYEFSAENNAEWWNNLQKKLGE